MKSTSALPLLFCTSQTTNSRVWGPFKVLKRVANRAALVGIQVGGVMIVQHDALIGLTIHGRFDVMADSNTGSIDSAFIKYTGQQPRVLIGQAARLK